MARMRNREFMFWVKYPVQSISLLAVTTGFPPGYVDKISLKGTMDAE
ncbi:MAG: hypothetical protein IT242_04200 [Bacteroidia bacterium]|nr:hypothetical protein [Bacteroidia bacterium]